MSTAALPSTQLKAPFLRPPARAEEPASLPLTVIEPGRQTLGRQLAELWAGRELVFFLAWRDIKVRYQQTSLGVAWALLQPLTQMAIFAVIFGRYAGLAKDTRVAYLWFVLAGLVPWTFFATAVSAASQSMVGSRELLTKVYFPRLAMPMAATFACLVDFAIGLALLLGAVALAGVPFTWAFLGIPPLLLLLLATTLGGGILLAAAVAAYRDFRFLVPFILQVGLFCTPIIYPATLFPAAWRWLLFLNPLAGAIEALRACLFGGWTGETTLHLTLSAAAGCVLLYAALDVFRRMERGLADRI